MEAQSADRKLEIGAHLAGTRFSEFGDSDFGVGGRVAYRVSPLLGVEANLGYFPSELPSGAAFSKSRVEGLFGVNVGPRFGKLGTFGTFRPGFVRFSESPAAIACILIFPPPLPCTLADGKTVLALDFGGGVEYLPAERVVVRFDFGDNVLRYPTPALTKDDAFVEEGGFWSHNFRFAIGIGARF